MGKFDDFNLEVKKVGSVQGVEVGEGRSGVECVSWAVTSVITSNMLSTLSTASESCLSCGKPSCNCSPSDMTVCRNANGSTPRC